MTRLIGLARQSSVAARERIVARPLAAGGTRSSPEEYKWRLVQWKTRLVSLEDQYIFLTNHLDDYLTACKTDTDRDSVTGNYVNSRRNYWTCINKTFHDDDPKVVAVVTQMGAAQKSLEGSLAQLGQIATVLNTIASAVKGRRRPGSTGGIGSRD